MSILNGCIAREVIYPEQMGFGEELEVISVIAEPSICVAKLCKDVLVVGGEKISLYRILPDGKAEFISSFDITGRARQIGIVNGYAYISARENGVYVCDLRDVQNPSIVYCIDSVELATGIAVSNGVLAVTNRHMGCELFDIAAPNCPERIGSFMCGEAQSVCLFDNYAVIGDWMNKRARIFDISCGNEVREISVMPVDGFADGVCTLEISSRRICVIASGHHSARLKNRKKYEKYTYVTAEMLSDGYGGGHGIEIYDITNPNSPEWLSGIKAPPLFGGLDTWLVFTDGNSIVFTDSMNGVFTIDVTNPIMPKVTGHYKLSPLERQRITPPSVQIQTGAITGAATVNGFLCCASQENGVSVLKSSFELGDFICQDAKKPIIMSENPCKEAFYKSKGQLHGFTEICNKVYCACGNSGIEVIDTFGRLIYTHKTTGICHDICSKDNFIITAEGSEGVAVYGIGEELSELSRFSDTRGCVRQVILTKDGFAAQCGQSEIYFFTLTKSGELSLYATHRIPGILYHRHVSRLDYNGAVLTNSLALGPTLVTISDGTAKQNRFFHTEFCPFAEGGCIYGDKIAVIHRGRYSCFDAETGSCLTDASVINGAKLDGYPEIVNGRLVVFNRYSGLVEAFDITDIAAPKLIVSVYLNKHPEFCGLINGELYLACGFDGIVKL